MVSTCCAADVLKEDTIIPNYARQSVYIGGCDKRFFVKVTVTLRMLTSHMAGVRDYRRMKRSYKLTENHDSTDSHNVGQVVILSSIIGSHIHCLDSIGRFSL